MQKIVFLVVLAVCALIASGMLARFFPGRKNLASAPGAMTNSDYERAGKFGDRKRTYRLHIPASVKKMDDGRTVPLVIAFHGRLGQGKAMARMSKFNSLADEHGFIVVYPDGFGRSWNAGHGAGAAERKGINDLRFIAKLIDELIQELPIDGRRIFAVGISNGAMFVHRLGCQLSDKIVAIATVAGTMPSSLARECHPGTPLSVLIIHGTEDRFSPWAGGATKGGGQVESVEATVRFWRTAGHCNSTPQITDLGNRVSRESYGACQGGNEVVLYRVEGAGHSWPGGDNPIPAKIVGEINQSWNASLAIWQFFQKHSKTVEPRDSPASAPIHR